MRFGVARGSYRRDDAQAMKNEKTCTRRTLLGAAAAAGAVTALTRAGSAQSAARAEVEGESPVRKRPTLALASYSTRKFDLDRTLAMTQRLALDAICLKSFHLPLDSSPETIAACVAKTKEAGITLYGGGVINMKSAADVERAFEYARAAGMVRIVCSPVPEVLPLLEEQVRSYDIEACIHNHGPGDRHWATPEIAVPEIAHLDPRVGLCHDVGHTVRFGADPVAATKKYAQRILDVHLKDVTQAAREGHGTPCGRGVIDLPALLRAMLEVGYDGYLAFEYERQPDDPLPGLAESVGYVRGRFDVL